MVTIQTLEDSQEPRPGLLTLVEESPLLLEPQFLWLHSERYSPAAPASREVIMYQRHLLNLYEVQDTEQDHERCMLGGSGGNQVPVLTRLTDQKRRQENKSEQDCYHLSCTQENRILVPSVLLAV